MLKKDELRLIKVLWDYGAKEDEDYLFHGKKQYLEWVR